jgi:hypothetical protein
VRTEGVGCGFGSSVLAAFLFSACVLAIAWSQQVPSGQTPFVSTAGGYVVDYPSDWHRFPPGSLPTLDIYNFPFSRAGGGVLPDGGASIALVPAPERVASIEDWIKADGGLREEKARSTISLVRPSSREPLRVVEVVSLTGEGMENVDCYFEIPGRLLVGRLSYWPDDPRAKEYRELLHRIIQSARPLVR